MATNEEGSRKPFGECGSWPRHCAPDRPGVPAFAPACSGSNGADHRMMLRVYRSARQLRRYLIGPRTLVDPCARPSVRATFSPGRMVINSAAPAALRCRVGGRQATVLMPAPPSPTTASRCCCRQILPAWPDRVQDHIGERAEIGMITKRPIHATLAQAGKCRRVMSMRVWSNRSRRPSTRTPPPWATGPTERPSMFTPMSGGRSRRWAGPRARSAQVGSPPSDRRPYTHNAQITKDIQNDDQRDQTG